MITTIKEFRKLNEQISMFDTNISTDDIDIFRKQFREFILIGMNIPVIKDWNLNEELIITNIDNGIRIDWSNMSDQDFFHMSKFLHYKGVAPKIQILQTIEKIFKKSHNYNYSSLSKIIDFENKTYDIILL